MSKWGKNAASGNQTMTLALLFKPPSILHLSGVELRWPQLDPDSPATFHSSFWGILRRSRASQEIWSLPACPGSSFHPVGSVREHQLEATCADSFRDKGVAPKLPRSPPDGWAYGANSFWSWARVCDRRWGFERRLKTKRTLRKDITGDICSSFFPIQTPVDNRGTTVQCGKFRESVKLFWEH